MLDGYQDKKELQILKKKKSRLGKIIANQRKILKLKSRKIKDPDLQKEQEQIELLDRVKLLIDRQFAYERSKQLKLDPKDL